MVKNCSVGKRQLAPNAFFFFGCHRELASANLLLFRGYGKLCCGYYELTSHLFLFLCRHGELACCCSELSCRYYQLAAYALFLSGGRGELACCRSKFRCGHGKFTSNNLLLSGQNLQTEDDVTGCRSSGSFIHKVFCPSNIPSIFLTMS